MADELSDQQIITWILDPGQQDRGFAALLNKYQERLYFHIRSIVKTHEDTNDVLQNMMIKVYKSLNNFKGTSKLYTWLYKIATNESLNYLKASKRHRNEALQDWQDDEATDTPEHNKINQILLKAVALLPQKQQLVFQLRYTEALSYDDISEITGTSKGALKASYHHAAKKIEQYLTEHADI